MKRLILSFCFTMMLFSFSFSQGKKYAVYSVGFYNLENLFDTQHDAGKNDFEYLPDGNMKWTDEKYHAKLSNMSQVISEMSTDMLPLRLSVLRVSEVENDHVLEDLVHQKSLETRNLQYVHIEGPDRRGIDCAVICNTRFFRVD